jgi:DNA invertase Pin-like site-specific DNA recombinase
MGKTIYDFPLRVTYYARVSTDKDERLNSLDNQKFYFDDFIKKCPNWTFAEGYIDEGISGTTAAKRDSFLRMVEDANQGLFDLILTKEISRFSRSTLDSIKYTQDLLSCGVGVLFQSDNINTILPDSELRLTIMASVAQEEVRKLSERVRFGMKRSIEKNRALGNSAIWGTTSRTASL